MKYPSLLNFLLSLTLLIAVSGCVIVINQPSPEEKALLEIQQDVGNQVKEINQKVEKTDFNQQEVSNLIDKAQQSIQTGLDKLNQLNLPEKTRQAAEKTRIYLESAQKIFGQLKGLLDEYEKLKTQGSELTDKAKQTIQQQITQIQTNLQSFRSQLSQIAENINQTGQQITDLYKQATQ